MKKVLLKISGEVFANKSAIDIEKTKKVADIIYKFHSSGYKVSVVVGGGNIIRGRDWKDSGGSNIDFSGMFGSVANAMAVVATMENRGIKAICCSPFPLKKAGIASNLEDAKDIFEKRYIVVFGGGIGEPGMSTDVCAADRAALLGVDLLIKLTQVDGIYDSDPMVNKDAKKFTKITLDEAIKRNLHVMDIAAMCIIKNKIPGIKCIVAKFSEKSAEEIISGNYNNCSVLG